MLLPRFDENGISPNWFTPKPSNQAQIIKKVKKIKISNTTLIPQIMLKIKKLKMQDFAAFF